MPTDKSPPPRLPPALDDNSRAVFPLALVFVNLYSPSPILLPEAHGGLFLVVRVTAI